MVAQKKERIFQAAVIRLIRGRCWIDVDDEAKINEE
jgi:hypothetical protein